MRLLNGRGWHGKGQFSDDQVSQIIAGQVETFRETAGAKQDAWFALIAFSVVAFAQGEPFTKFYTKYADNEQFTQVTVTSKMFSLFTNIEPGDPNEKEVLDAMSKLKGLKVLAADSTKDARKYYKEAAAGFTGSAYEELMSVKNGKDDSALDMVEFNTRFKEKFCKAIWPAAKLIASLSC